MIRSTPRDPGHIEGFPEGMQFPPLPTQLGLAGSSRRSACQAGFYIPALYTPVVAYRYDHTLLVGSRFFSFLPCKGDVLFPRPKGSGRSSLDTIYIVSLQSFLASKDSVSSPVSSYDIITAVLPQNLLHLRNVARKNYASPLSCSLHTIALHTPPSFCRRNKIFSYLPFYL